jgi:hypothetical protein
MQNMNREIQVHIFKYKAPSSPMHPLYSYKTHQHGFWYTINGRFGETCRPRLQGRWVSQARSQHEAGCNLCHSRCVPLKRLLIMKLHVLSKIIELLSSFYSLFYSQNLTVCMNYRNSSHDSS